MSVPEVLGARGETEVAQRIVDGLGVTTSPGTSVDAGWLAYVRHLVASLVRAVMERLSRLLDAVPLPAGWAKVLAWAVGLTALALVAIVVIRVVRGRRRPAPERAASARVSSGPDATAAERDAAGWRAELEALLAAGRSGEALRALWWWLARTLAGAGADPSWTGRELLAESGRTDLLPLVRRLERLTYGRSRPDAADVRGLAAEIEGALA